jgi:hypothetical protein
VARQCKFAGADLNSLVPTNPADLFDAPLYARLGYWMLVFANRLQLRKGLFSFFFAE